MAVAVRIVITSPYEVIAQIVKEGVWMQVEPIKRAKAMIRPLHTSVPSLTPCHAPHYLLGMLTSWLLLPLDASPTLLPTSTVSC
jgi:hypothetical protein